MTMRFFDNKEVLRPEVRPHDNRVCKELHQDHVVMVLRYSDGMRGGSLGLMYNLLQLDALYSSRKYRAILLTEISR